MNPVLAVAAEVKFGEFPFQMTRNGYSCREVAFSHMRNWIHSQDFHDYLLRCMPGLQGVHAKRMVDSAITTGSVVMDRNKMAVASLLHNSHELHSEISVAIGQKISDEDINKVIGWVQPYYPDAVLSLENLPKAGAFGLKGIKIQGRGGDPFAAYWWVGLMIRVLSAAVTSLRVKIDYPSFEGYIGEAHDKGMSHGFRVAFGTHPDDVPYTQESWTSLTRYRSMPSIYNLLTGLGPNDLATLPARNRSILDAKLMLMVDVPGCYVSPSAFPKEGNIYA